MVHSGTHSSILFTTSYLMGKNPEVVLALWLRRELMGCQTVKSRLPQESSMCRLYSKRRYVIKKKEGFAPNHLDQSESRKN